MQQIIITIGLPASGKSTWAEQQCKKMKNTVRINKDLIREMLANNHSIDFENEMVLTTRDALLRKYIEMGKNVIIDDTNFHERHTKSILKICDSYNKYINVRIQYFDTDVTTCVSRNQNRNNKVPDSVIEEMGKKYSGHRWSEKLNELRILCTTFNNRELRSYNRDTSLSKCIICDLDGTLALIGDRSPYDAAQCMKDTLNGPVERILRLSEANNPDVKIILLSGRGSEHRAETEKWLALHDVWYDHLYMRKAGDSRQDRVVKYELFKEHIEPHYNVYMSIDDRPQMTKLWKELGIFCIDVYQDPDHKDF